MVTTATPPAQTSSSAAPALPFPIASRQAMRYSFSTATVDLAASAATLVSPISIPAVGYLRYLNLEVTLTGTGGTTPAFTADAPFNVLSSCEFRTAAGNDLVVPFTGYQLYLADKWSAMFAQAPYCDNRLNNQYSATAPSAHFYLQIPFEIDPETGLGSLPALASNRTYQLILNFAAISTVLSGSPTANVQVNGTAYYWTQPPAVTESGVTQATAPYGLGTTSQWSLDTPPLTPGDKRLTLSNKEGIIRTLIFVLRNSSGARIGGTQWPGISDFSVDNESLFSYTQNEWEQLMQNKFALPSSTFDAAGGLDTGVYVIPFHALAGGTAGDPANSRSQYLPVIDASQLVLRGTSFGSSASTLEVLTQAIVPAPDPSVVFSK